MGAKLRIMLEQVGAASGIAFTSEIAPLENLFTPDEEVTIYRLVQECVCNIVKHSQASSATVVMKVIDCQLQIIISDDGRGFSTAALLSNPQSASGLGHHSQPGGFGLKGLEERVRILRGRHKITSAPGKGTKHQFTIPVSPDVARGGKTSHVD